MPKRAVKAICAAAMAAFAAAAFFGCSGAPPNDRIEGETAVFAGAREFKNGRMQGTYLRADGGIAMEKGKRQATYLSGTIEADPFQSLLFSCDADTPEDSTVRAEIQVEQGKAWSGWLNWGTWGASVKSGSNISAAGNSVAEMDEDVLQVIDGKTARAVRYRLTLERNASKEGPTVRSVAVSVRGAAQPAAKAGPSGASGKILDVPRLSQMTRDPKIAAEICSPTSVAMVLNYDGVGVLPEEAAWGAYDNNGLLFGNWAFNCAYAGSYGFTAFTEYLDSLDDIKGEIANGNPVVLSVRYKKDESVEGDLPVLHGAPIDKTEGHLLVICGFESKGGKEYAVVNDPAAPNDVGVRREYAADELERASFHVAYIIRPKSGSPAAPRRLTAKLVPTGKTRVGLDGTDGEYRLLFEGKAVDVSRNYARTVMFTSDGSRYRYLDLSSESTLWFGAGQKKGTYGFVVVCADRKVYTAELSLA